MNSEKKELIKYIESNVDLNLKFNDQHALTTYEFKGNYNITAIVRDILIQYRYKLMPIAEKVDLKYDLWQIYLAKRKCRKFLRRYRRDSKINFMYDIRIKNDMGFSS